MKTFFVTGGAGFIGGNFILNLMKTGQAKVINYDKLTYAGNLDTLSSIESDPNYIFEQGDICDRDKLQGLFEGYKIDCVVHFAAESHVDRSIDSPGDFIQTNVVGTFELLEAARWYAGAKKNSIGNTSAFYTFQQMKFMALWEKPACSRKKLHTHQIRRMPPPKPPPTI